ncbi:glycosyltransferase family 2 protein [Candidatus Pelagibacter bacterium]|nr:glycosyltransferase family 2 protein [Candidatus Pelagibacter bacterium]
MENKKKKKTKIDIVLPNYNSHEFIEETIKSITNQTYFDWKLTIVDDNSEEKTKNILKGFSKNKKIKIYWLKKNRGAGFCRNYALKKTKSPYVAFIDSDDIWEKNKLKDQINFMLKNKYLFSYTYYKTFGDKKKLVTPPTSFNYSNFIRDTSIATSTMMVKRNVIKNIKFSKTKICEDYYFKCKLLKKVKYAFCINKFLTSYRVRKNSLQSSNLRNFFWIWKINKDYNKLSFLENFFSLLSISINSIKKYGGKNFF